MVQKTIELDRTPLSSSDVQQLDIAEVDPQKSYYATIQLGASKSWRTFGNGRWELKDGRYHHKAAVHNVGPIRGTTLQGLMVSHNDWQKANQNKTLVVGVDSHETLPGRAPAQREVAGVYKGSLDRQMLVLDWRETTDRLKEPRQRQDQGDMLEKAVKSAIVEMIPLITEAVAKGLKSAK